MATQSNFSKAKCRCPGAIPRLIESNHGRDDHLLAGACFDSAGRVVDGIVKAIINRTDDVRLQVDFGKDEIALVYLWQARETDS